jgi:hypothetical protein
MLSAGNKQEHKAHLWIQKFQSNSSCIPLVPIHRTDPVVQSPRKKGTSVTTHVYQIVFDSVSGIPVPPIALQTASKSNSSISCRLSISLFDLESISFFGKTWKSPVAIPIIEKLSGEKKEDSESDTDSDDSNDHDIDKQRAYFLGNKLNLQLKQQV